MFVKPSHVDPLELHWLAGLLEGEGSFMVGPPSDPRRPAIAVQMTDEDVMRRIESQADAGAASTGQLRPAPKRFAHR